ncbi:uncharacterized protein LOC129191298 [Dunckerocampus dactyliophorus]|uniref:uncharacterized protein LOC129191298 n=1 Tax=Dunckerocampus dactyliophorus TaxID=161453 RepID=UPI0024054960|nr:uncharacterized protein LOC129191298 [Dunckerocampus dactyliophorus]
MSRGQTWSCEETQALIAVWSDDYIAQLLATTHKNIHVFNLFSEKMAAWGFNRTAQQCRIKVKKLRQHYIKVRDSIRNNGCSGDEKDKFPWYDQLDEILGTRPISSPKQASLQDDVPITAIKEEPDDVSQCSVSREWCKSGSSEIHLGDESTTSSAPSSESPRPEQETNGFRWTVPGAQNKKRKSRVDRFDIFLESYMQQKRQMDEADRKRRDEERAAFEKFMRMQQEADERRFKAMQEQQQVNNQLLLQMMGILDQVVKHLKK